MKCTNRLALTLFAGLGISGLGLLPLVTGQETKPPGSEAVKERSKTVTGRVKSYVKNGRGDVDGLLLEDGTKVHFPPHVGDEVQKIVSPDSQVKVYGHDHTTPKGEAVFRAERIESGNSKIEIDEPAPPRGPRPPHGPRREAERPMSAAGKIRDFHKNKHGDVDGFALEEGTEVKLPPHLGEELQALAKVGDEVKVEGRRHETPKGDIHLHADRITSSATGKILERDEPGRHEHAPPFAEILEELRAIRRLLEANQKP
ncbi:OB-fold nucleic acid binding domain-containing protein [Schlesneria sp. T3-172]|uniref:OB-fold nucleic acid binding domain-containing protein n=1 Tax=Schlesneria TaxID=656899 RepID=UPI002F1DC900